MICRDRAQEMVFSLVRLSAGADAKTCQPRSCITLGLLLCTGTSFFFLGPKGKRSSALGRNARPARFRPGLVEERQGWDESFFSLLFFPPGLVGTIE